MRDYDRDGDGATLVFVSDLNTFMASADNETHLCGTDQNGNPIHLIIPTFELLEWLDVEHMKKQTINYIRTK